eukprot:751003-Pyramimonas_sp.AAC.1
MLRVLESAIGLALNFRNCTVPICGRGRKDEVSDMMSKGARGMEMVGVSSAIKYLGVYWNRCCWHGLERPAAETCCKMCGAPSARPWICDD